MKPKLIHDWPRVSIEHKDFSNIIKNVIKECKHKDRQDELKIEKLIKLNEDELEMDDRDERRLHRRLSGEISRDSNRDPNSNTVCLINNLNKISITKFTNCNKCFNRGDCEDCILSRSQSGRQSKKTSRRHSSRHDSRISNNTGRNIIVGDDDVFLTKRLLTNEKTYFEPV